MTTQTHTISRVLLTGGAAEEDRELLREWAEKAVANGGKVSIVHDYHAGDWWATYTIYWPSTTEETSDDLRRA